jgi:hypothetical protein
MRLHTWRPLFKGALRGFATIELLPIGLQITVWPVFVSHDNGWATLPSKPILDRDGQHATIDGKAQYVAVHWRDRALADRFSAAVVDLVRCAHPDDLRQSTGDSPVRGGIP